MTSSGPALARLVTSIYVYASVLWRPACTDVLLAVVFKRDYFVLLKEFCERFERKMVKSGFRDKTAYHALCI